MRDYDVRELHDMGNDRLRIRGTNRLEEVYGAEGVVIDHVDVIDEAYGWVSALENHYPPEAYDPKTGELLEDEDGRPVVKPRRMTKDERLAYCQRLLAEQNLQEPRELPI